MSTAAQAARIRAVLNMYEFGELMYRARLAREHPEATVAETNALVQAWRLDRPGAPTGDAVGPSSTRFG